MRKVRTDLNLPVQALRDAACVRGLQAYRALADEADADHSAYWARLARECISWKTPFTRSFDDSEAPYFKWSEDAIWGESERFRLSYFPPELRGYYLAGDGAIRDEEAVYFTITGRIDDVLNVSGHRLGAMEIESALLSCTDLVAEAAVVGRPDDTTGEAVCAFVVLKGNRPNGEQAAVIAKKVRDWVGKETSPIAEPKDIRFGDNLPKTRSGKIPPRLLRSIAKGKAVTQDVSTLENPALLKQLAESS